MPRPAAVWLGLLVMAAAGCGGKNRPPAAGDDQPATAFLKQIQSGQTEAAWSGTSTEFKSFMGQAEFAQYVRKHPPLKATAEFRELVAKTDQEPPLTVCTYRTAGAKPATITVTLCWEDGVWKVGKLAVD